MKLLNELLPLLVFFLGYKLYDIFVGTALLILASFLQLVYMKLKHGKVEKQALITFLALLFFGGLTLAFHDDLFLKWKVSIVNWGFALACLLCSMFTGKPLIQHLMGSQLQLAPPIWTKLNLIWALFFFSMGTLNIFIAYTFSTEVWVNFKLFGMLGLTLVFMVLQSFYLVRHMST